MLLLTCSISVADIWKSPHITQTYSVAQTWQDKVHFPWPISSFCVFILLWTVRRRITYSIRFRMVFIFFVFTLVCHFAAEFSRQLKKINTSASLCCATKTMWIILLTENTGNSNCCCTPEMSYKKDIITRFLSIKVIMVIKHCLWRLITLNTWTIDLCTLIALNTGISQKAKFIEIEKNSTIIYSRTILAEPKLS